MSATTVPSASARRRAHHGEGVNRSPVPASSAGGGLGPAPEAGRGGALGPARAVEASEADRAGARGQCAPCANRAVSGPAQPPGRCPGSVGAAHPFLHVGGREPHNAAAPLGAGQEPRLLEAAQVVVGGLG